MLSTIDDIQNICGMEILECVYMNDNIKIHIGDKYGFLCKVFNSVINGT